MKHFNFFRAFLLPAFLTFFSAWSMAQSVVSVTPDSAGLGDVVVLQITASSGHNFYFNQATTVLSRANGMTISPDSESIINDTTIVAQFTIPNNPLYIGFWNVEADYPFIAPLINGFEVGGVLTGEREEIASRPVHTYPNPFSDRLTFDFGELENEVLTLQITDLTGRVVRLENNITSGLFTLDTGDLSNQMYLYTLFSEEKVRAHGKLLLQR